MVLLDHAGRILDFNEAFTKFSKNADQYQGLKVWDVLPLADPCALHEALDTSRYLNEPNTIDVAVRHPYGERFVPLQATITPLRADDTRWQALVTFVNVHHIRLAEQMALDERVRAMQLRTRMHSVVKANELIAERVDCLSFGGCSVQSVLETVAEQACAVASAPVGAICTRDASGEVELFAQLGTSFDLRQVFGGRGRRADAIYVPIQRESRPIGALYLARPRKHSAFQIEDHLLVSMLGGWIAAALIAARSADAVQSDMATLRRLERLRDEWALMVAHDLRQPLSAIKASEELLAALTPATSVEGEAARAIERIRQCSARIGTMIDELVDSSLMGVQQLVLERRAMSMADAVRSVLELLAPHLSDRPIRTELDEAATIVADDARVGQVLGNLIGNAHKYAFPGTPITITVRRAQGAVVTSITNIGPEIGAADLPHIFSRFFRGGATRKATRGLGLGLHIARGLVDAHGGNISVESSANATTFTFSLPLDARDGTVIPLRAADDTVQSVTRACPDESGIARFRARTQR